MTIKERFQAGSWSVMEIVLSVTLALLLIGGLIGAVYLYQVARTFALESQLPLFPSVAAAAEEFPTHPEVAAPVEPDSSTGQGSAEAPATEQEAGEPSGEEEPAPDDNSPLVLPPDNMPPSSDTMPPPATERMTVLVMGVDRREEEEGPWRTDTMILVSVDPKSNSAAMLSFPRDLFVTIPDYGYGERRDKINTAFFHGDAQNYPGGGAALAKQTIRRNFGIEVDRYIVTDFDGFRRVIDYIGGIEIDVPELLVDYEYPTEDYGTVTVRFEPGVQVMNGERALIYSRTRKSTSDFARAERQQVVIMAVRDRVLSLDIIPSLTPANLARLISTVNDSIMTDMSVDEVLALAQVAREIEEEEINRGLIDSKMITEYWTYQGTQALLPQWDEVIPLLEETFEMELLEIEPMAELPPPLPTATPVPTRRPWPTWTPTPRGGPWPIWTPTGINTDEEPTVPATPTITGEGTPASDSTTSAPTAPAPVAPTLLTPVIDRE